MTTRLSRLICAGLTWAALFGAAEARPQRRASPPRPWSWEGTYRYQEGVGRGGEFVEHTLVVTRAGGGLAATLEAAGFQTSISLKCEAREEGNRLLLYFKEYGEDNLAAEYRKGELLLTLERAGPPPAGGKLLTRWAAYRPVLRKAKGAGVYFRKV